MKKLGDYHIHTNLSNCGHKDALPAAYAALAAGEGITDIGFSNHMWDEKIPGASQWYSNQTVTHVLSIRDELPEDSLAEWGVRVHVGCEIDIDKHFTVGMASDTRALFDYVLVATSHLHMKDFAIDRNVTSLPEVRTILLRRVDAALNACVADGIAHPFGVLGFYDRQDELLGGYTDGELIGVFRAAADAGVSLELNATAVLDHPGETDADGFSIQDKRLFTLARECGCRFHLGTDAHWPEAFCRHRELIAFAAACGIHEFAALEHRR